MGITIFGREARQAEISNVWRVYGEYDCDGCFVWIFYFLFFLFQWIFIRKIIRSVGVFASRMGWMIEWMWIFTSVLVIVLIFVGGEELLIFSDESILLLFKYRRWKFVLIWDRGEILFSREYIVVLGKNRNYFKLLVLLVNSDRNGVNYNRMLYFITLYINCTSCLS